jgi:hypothetical protein
MGQTWFFATRFQAFSTSDIGIPRTCPREPSADRRHGFLDFRDPSREPQTDVPLRFSRSAGTRHGFLDLRVGPTPFGTDVDLLAQDVRSSFWLRMSGRPFGSREPCQRVFFDPQGPRNRPNPTPGTRIQDTRGGDSHELSDNK